MVVSSVTPIPPAGPSQVIIIAFLNSVCIPFHDEDQPVKITLYENLRAIPYVPYYAALERRAFLAEGLEVRVETSPDPSQTANALLEGKVDVAWGGPARVLHHYELDPECALVCFCQVVTRDPFFLVGRMPNSTFVMSDLLGARRRKRCRSSNTVALFAA